ncbi:MAG: glycoside hydrolase family 3 N-terminal domain-containing protein, partial [Myxococcota bacterium]|nr:glycoside hydrolase family 3 N-terminal domain-containing protein [Myxococcota bacterium]
MDPIEERVQELLARMTLEEKASLTAGSGPWHGVAIPRLGIPRLKVTDGPTGARGEAAGGALTAACFPNGSALAATFDPDLVERVGEALAQEARSKGAHVLLGPTVNMHRSPLGGRHFECYSEDPHLAARIAVAFVRGVQRLGVGTSVKHFVANDSEFERHTISSELDARTLREIYLPPFEGAVREAGAWTVMAAYNRIGGTYACEHEALLRGVLKEEWGFDGVVVSDWGAVHTTAETARGGCDLEMPGPARHLGPALAKAVEAGEVPEAVVDDMARR